MELKQLQTDPALEQDGAWLDFDAETSFLIGSPNSRRYKEAFRREREELRKRTRFPTDEEAEALNIRVYARTIVLGWKGMTNDGKPFDYTPENAELVLKTCPSVRDFVFLSASNIENFRRQLTEEAKATLGES